MRVKRVCPYCKRTFTTEKNARIYCTKRCAAYIQKKKQKTKNKDKCHLCQWCAKRFRTSRYRTKFCSCSCRGEFLKASNRLMLKTIKKPIRHTTSEIVRKSREAGLSYGIYVGINRLD